MLPLFCSQILSWPACGFNRYFPISIPLFIFHKGDLSGIPLRYQSILDYASKQGLTLSGFSYEKGMNETVVDKIEDYIVQIEIPIGG